MGRYGRPHCWGKMLWILDEEPGHETNVCSSCEERPKDCLALTRKRAEEEKREVDALRTDDGKLDVYDKRLREIFKKWKE